MILCLPLPADTLLGWAAYYLQTIGRNNPLLDLVFFGGYMVLFPPALFLIEPFAIVATIWFTNRWLEPVDESFGALCASWLAVALHTVNLWWYLHRGWNPGPVHAH